MVSVAMPRDSSLSQRNARFHYLRARLTLVRVGIAHCIPHVMQMHPLHYNVNEWPGICINRRNSSNVITQCIPPLIDDISEK